MPISINPVPAGSYVRSMTFSADPSLNQAFQQLELSVYQMDLARSGAIYGTRAEKIAAFETATAKSDALIQALSSLSLQPGEAAVLAAKNAEADVLKKQFPSWANSRRPLDSSEALNAAVSKWVRGYLAPPKRVLQPITKPNT